MFKTFIKKEKPFRPTKFKRNFRYASFFTISFVVIAGIVLYILPNDQKEIEGKIISYGLSSNDEGNHLKIVVELETGKRVNIQAPFNTEIKREGIILITEIKTVLGLSKYYFKNIKRESNSQ
jgi:hypothetical protein